MADSIDMQLSFGAASIDLNTTSLTPNNQGKLYGPAGAEILVTTNNSSILIDNEGSFKTFLLNEQGIARFSLSSTLFNPQFALTATYGVEHITRTSSFLTYTQESASGFIYNVTTAAAADGAMVNSIYIDRDNIDASSVNARFIDAGSSAQFISAPGEQTHDFPFSSDGVTSIHVINTQEESVHILLSIDGGYATVVEMGFVAPVQISQAHS